MRAIILVLSTTLVRPRSWNDPQDTDSSTVQKPGYDCASPHFTLRFAGEEVLLKLQSRGERLKRGGKKITDHCTRGEIIKANHATNRRRSQD